MFFDILTILLIVSATLFFIAGTLGLLRFPDAYTRLHAITKADNVGLGFIVFGLVLQADSLTTVLLLLLIWLLVMLAGAGGGQLVADAALRHNIPVWTEAEEDNEILETPSAQAPAASGRGLLDKS